MVAAVATPRTAFSAPVPRPVWPVEFDAPDSSAWVELDAARAALRSIAGVTCALIRAIPDPAYPIPGTSTPIGDAAAHLVLTAQIAADSFAGFPSPIHDLGARRDLNARHLARFPERRPRILASLLEDVIDLLLDAPLDDDLIPFHAGIPLDPGVIIGLLVADMMAQGWEIARTLGLPWSAEPSAARVASTATIRMLPHLLAESAQGATASYRIHIRGGDDITCRLAQGRMIVTRRDAAPVDCHVSADPVAFVLVAHRRVSRLGRVARGQFVSWGQNPALGAILPRLFVAP